MERGTDSVELLAAYDSQTCFITAYGRWGIGMGLQEMEMQSGGGLLFPPIIQSAEYSDSVQHPGEYNPELKTFPLSPAAYIRAHVVLEHSHWHCPFWTPFPIHCFYYRTIPAT
jgi:hypothetical protein